jgi:DNA polymerase-3 subunit delta'
MPTGDTAAIRAELARARGAGRVHTGYLLDGAASLARRETALWLARLLLCETEGDDPCESCRQCLRSVTFDREGQLATGHPDLKIVEPDGANVKVEQIRRLQLELSHHANEGGHRVALILGAESLRIEAANALLKTLEEPPDRTSLILEASTASLLPPTVLSRTIRFRFAPEPEEGLAEELRGDGFEDEDAWLAATLGGGNLSAARAWSERHLEAARELRELIETACAGGPGDALDAAEGFRGGEAGRERALLFFDVHGAIARRAVESAAKRGDSAELDRWLGQFERGQEARGEMIRRNLNPRLVIENLLIAARA